MHKDIPEFDWDEAERIMSIDDKLIEEFEKSLAQLPFIEIDESIFTEDLSAESVEKIFGPYPSKEENLKGSVELPVSGVGPVAPLPSTGMGSIAPMRKKTSVRIKIEVLDQFKREAERRSTKYQTLINDVLARESDGW